MLGDGRRSGSGGERERERASEFRFEEGWRDEFRALREEVEMALRLSLRAEAQLDGLVFANAGAALLMRCGALETAFMRGAREPGR